MNTFLKVAAGVVIGVAGAFGGAALARRLQGRPEHSPEAEPDEVIAPNGATGAAQPIEVSP